jgi:phosphoserine aminotransferase
MIKESDKSASFIVNGAWSKKAMNECAKYISVNEISNIDGSTPSIEQRKEQWNLDKCSYVYMCSNETV